MNRSVSCDELNSDDIADRARIHPANTEADLYSDGG